MADTWLEAINDHLDRLEGTHLQKRRDTVIQIVDARLSGRSDASALARPDTCSPTVFYNKWMKDPVFAEVLEIATSTARRWKSEEHLRALHRAARALQLSSTRAVARLIELLDSGDERVQLDSAKSILDRAGVATAIKAAVASHNTEGGELTLEEWRQQAGERSGQVAETLRDFDEDWQDEDDWPDDEDTEEEDDE